MSQRSPCADAGSSTPTQDHRRCQSATRPQTIAGSVAMSWTRSTLPIARRQLGLSGIDISPSAPFRLSRRCRARCGRGRSTPKSPTSRRRRSWPLSASNRPLQAGAAGSRSNAWASRFLARAGVGWYRGAQRDRRATFFACFAARALYLARSPTLRRGGSRSRLLHQWACGLSLRKATIALAGARRVRAPQKRPGVAIQAPGGGRIQNGANAVK